MHVFAWVEGAQLYVQQRIALAMNVEGRETQKCFCYRLFSSFRVVPIAWNRREVLVEIRVEQPAEGLLEFFCHRLDPFPLGADLKTFSYPFAHRYRTRISKPG